MKTRAGIFAAILIVTACGKSIENQIDEACRQCFPEGEPGAAVLILKGDRVLFDKGYGVRDLGTMEPIDGDTPFNIASISKQFTSVAVLQLASDGLINLSDPVGKYFPEYTAPLWNKVEIRHLLSHSSGIGDLRGGIPREEKIFGDEDLATAYLDTLSFLRFEPGSAYEYINPTFVLLGKLVERISGKPFTEYVKERIFTPAGMERTWYFDRKDTPGMAHGYEYADVSLMGEEREAGSEEGPKNWYEYDFGEETFFATRPDGGIYTSTHEFVLWEKALRRTLEGKDGALPCLKPDLLLDAMSPHTLVSGSRWSDYQNRPGTWYGYGWFVEPEKKCIYHTGDNGGFKALAARYPESGLLILIFANRADWDRENLKVKLEKILDSKCI